MGIFNTGDQGGQRSWASRLIGALALALIGLFMYMSQVQENPVTGERQHVSLTTDQEIRLGLQSAPEMAKKMGGELPATDPRTKLVQKIGAMIVSKTNAAKSPWKFQFHLLADTETINAFALPGGQIFITLGLMNKLENEAQLAGVLSHEMGHVLERHSAQQMAKNQFGNILVAAAGSAGDARYDPTLVASMVNQMFQLRYSRQDESEADIWGLKLMEQVDFDPTAMIEVMRILKASSGPQGGPEIFQTHPNPDLRIKQIKEYLEKHPPKPNLSKGKSLRRIQTSV